MFPGQGKSSQLFEDRIGDAIDPFAQSGGQSPEWLTDSTVVVPRLGNRSLQVVGLNTGEHRLLPGVDTVGWMLSPRTSPDRKELAYMWNPGVERR